MLRYLHLLSLCLLLSFALLPRHALANNNRYDCASGNLPTGVINNIKIADNLAVGDHIPGSDIRLNISTHCDKSVNYSSSNGVYYCYGGWQLIPVSKIKPRLVQGYSNVFTYDGWPSNIGYQVIASNGEPNDDIINRMLYNYTGYQMRLENNSIPVHLRLVKISDDLQSGSFSTQMYLGCNYDFIEWANGNIPSSTITFGFTTEVITQTCHLDEPDVQIRLPQVARSSFKAMGDSAGTTPFNLHFQCDANTYARFNISDANNQLNATDTLSLVSGSTAKGLGVRLRHEGNPVLLAPHQIFDAGGSEFSLHNASPTQNMISVPLSAEYVQSGGSITAGSIMAQGIVTIDYN